MPTRKPTRRQALGRAVADILAALDRLERATACEWGDRGRVLAAVVAIENARTLRVDIVNREG
jgi:hypothetical protein